MMMSDFPHTVFKAGDCIINTERPKWGKCTVITATKDGAISFEGEVYDLQPNTKGQRLVVEFENGRRRTLHSTSHPLKFAED